MELSLRRRIMHGLRQYIVPPELGGGIRTSSTGDTATSSKSKKKGSATGRTRAEALNLGRAGEILQVEVKDSDIYSSRANRYLDMALMSSIAVLVSGIIDHLLHYIFSFPRSPMLLILAVFSVFQCLAALATSEILDRYTSSTNKVVISAVGLITFLISFVCLGLGPSGVVDIGFERADRSIGPFMTSVFEKKGALIRSVYDRFGMEPPQLGSGMDGIIAGANMGGSRSAKLSLGLTLSLSVMAGILAPLVCTAALRFARCYNVAINPPGWSSSLRASTLGAASLHVALVAPVLCLAMFLQLLGIGDLLSDTAMFWARWGAICACGFIMLLGSRTAIQSYLNTAMVAWFVAKNKALKPEDTSGTVAKEIRNINTVINYFIHRVSTQAIAPGALLVALGAMLLSGSVAASEQPKVRVADLLMMSPEVIDCVASFLAFTFIAIWVTFTTLSLGMFQTGALAQEEFGRS